MLLAATTTQKVNVIVAVLLLLGVAILGGTIWFWRSTRPDPEALGPLEVMSDGHWRNATFSDRRARLEAARPDNSEMAAAYIAAQPSAVDLGELAAGRELPAFDDHAGFGDLHELRVDPERPDLRGGLAPGATDDSNGESGDTTDDVAVAVASGAVAGVSGSGGGFDEGGVGSEAESLPLPAQVAVPFSFPSRTVKPATVSSTDPTAADGISFIPGDPLTIVRSDDSD